ncbi:hypothetical protein SAMN05443428_1099 [Caloramator quimbayensis]|uniref:Uncharacterized protein n=1 Tax=Caloramator quimbayensis TaxID=1147123 RepID=A0A1T4XHL0_9CLOT|nr:hypothetical protein [Caloramator quimbayensis]SKA88611.1 hypothetical protein SAMN05443428_1099 [Caloramator quimbayensis]
MSNWQVYNFENRIRDILSNVNYSPNPFHHFKRPYLSAYQIAIEFNRLYPNDVTKMGYVVGGDGSNTNKSLARYIANELSKRIKAGEITDIEGAFISSNFLKEMVFDNNGQDVISSSLGSEYDLSMFRLKV